MIVRELKVIRIPKGRSGELQAKLALIEPTHQETTPGQTRDERQDVPLESGQLAQGLGTNGPGKNREGIQQRACLDIEVIEGRGEERFGVSDDGPGHLLKRRRVAACRLLDPFNEGVALKKRDEAPAIEAVER